VSTVHVVTAVTWLIVWSPNLTDQWQERERVYSGNPPLENIIIGRRRRRRRRSLRIGVT